MLTGVAMWRSVIIISLFDAGYCVLVCVTSRVRYVGVIVSGYRCAKDADRVTLSLVAFKNSAL